MARSARKKSPRSGLLRRPIGFLWPPLCRAQQSGIPASLPAMGRAAGRVRSRRRYRERSVPRSPAHRPTEVAAAALDKTGAHLMVPTKAAQRRNTSQPRRPRRGAQYANTWRGIDGLGRAASTVRSLSPARQLCDSRASLVADKAAAPARALSPAILGAGCLSSPAGGRDSLVRRRTTRISQPTGAKSVAEW